MKKKNLILLLLALIFLPLLKASAFSLNYEPPKEVNLGETFKVEISLDNKDLIIKAIEGVLSFDSNSFEFLGFNSSFDKWIKEPFLYEENQIYFSGVFDSLLDNSIFSLVFKKNNNADFNLDLNSGTILAEDELYSLEGINSFSESLFNIESSTHPDSDVFYNESKVRLNWTVPKDASKIKILIDENEFSYPSVEYTEPIINEKEIELDDGIFYFHIRCFNKDGWSEIENKRIMIDTERPEDLNFSIQKNIIEFEKNDDLSYEIYIPSTDEKYLTSQSFDFSFLEAGTYKVILRAYDKAKNYIEKEISFKVEGVSSPQFSGAVLEKNNVYIFGYIESEDTKVITSINGEDFFKQEVLETSSDGQFVYYLEDLKPGLYDLNLIAIKDNNLSKENKKIILIVDSKLDFKIMAEIIVGYGITILALLLLYIISKKDKKNKKIKNKKHELKRIPRKS